MASIRIDNLSSDTVTVFLDGQEAVIEEDAKFTFESLEKGGHTLRIHRTRIPYESSSSEKAEKDNPFPLFSEEKSLHTPLDYIAELDLNSSRAVLTVKSDITSAEGKGLDAIFTSYTLTPAGAKTERERKLFANNNIKNAFLSHHIKSALFPTGVCSLVIFIIGIVSLFCAINGSPIDVGGTKFTLPWAIALVAVALALVAYTTYCLLRIFRKSKELKE